MEIKKRKKKKKKKENGAVISPSGVFCYKIHHPEACEVTPDKRSAPCGCKEGRASSIRDAVRVCSSWSALLCVQSSESKQHQAPVAKEQRILSSVTLSHSLCSSESVCNDEPSAFQSDRDAGCSAVTGSHTYPCPWPLSWLCALCWNCAFLDWDTLLLLLLGLRLLLLLQRHLLPEPAAQWERKRD